jgi:hypothetical protein
VRRRAGEANGAWRTGRRDDHARPSITLDIYAHEFEHARGLDDVRDSIDAAFGASRI